MGVFYAGKVNLSCKGEGGGVIFNAKNDVADFGPLQRDFFGRVPKKCKISFRMFELCLRILIWPLEVPFSQRWALLAKMTVFGLQKMALRVAKSKF